MEQGPYGPASARGAGRRMGPRPGEQQLNPVLWQGSPDVVGPGHDDRRARVGPYSTAVVGNVLVRQDGRKGREDLRHEAETGASNLIYNRGPNAPGVEYGEGVEPNYRFDRALNRQVAGARTHELHRETGAGSLIYGRDWPGAAPAAAGGTPDAAPRAGPYGGASASAPTTGGRGSATAATPASTGNAVSGVSRSDMLLRGPEELGRPVRPAHYVASADSPTFTKNHTAGHHTYYSVHVPPSQKSHGDVIAWTGETTAPSDAAYSRRLRETGQAGNPNKAREGTDRTLYDTYSRSIDIQSAAERRAWDEAMAAAPGGALGLGERAAALQPGRRNVAPARYANAGNITAWGGGTGFDPADAQRELEAFRRPQLARVASEIAEHDRAAGRYPYASRTE